jgi:hypothetical protein
MRTRRTRSCAAFARSSLVKLVRRPRRKAMYRCSLGRAGADAAGRLNALNVMHRER